MVYNSTYETGVLGDGFYGIVLTTLHSFTKHPLRNHLVGNFHRIGIIEVVIYYGDGIMMVKSHQIPTCVVFLMLKQSITYTGVYMYIRLNYVCIYIYIHTYT